MSTGLMLPTDKKNDTFDEFQVKKPSKKRNIIYAFQIGVTVIIVAVALLVLLFLRGKEMKKIKKEGLVDVTWAVVNKSKPTSHQDQHVTVNVSSVNFINLGKSKDRIILFEPSMKYCFNISRSGRYYLALSIRLRCSSHHLEHVSIMLKNKSLESPATITKPTLCTETISDIFVQKTFEAKKFSQILMESSISLKGYSGNFLKLEWYEECL